MTVEKNEIYADTHIAVLRDWRQLGYVERGARDGFPILALHGVPGSRMQHHPDSDIALRRGARVICVERPGFGMSTPLPHHSLSDWAADIADFADRLEIERFAMVAVSSGGPFALACAALLGDRVMRVAIASGFGPPGAMRRHAPHPISSGLRLASHAPWLLRAALNATRRRARNEPDLYLERLARHLSPVDTELLQQVEVRGMLTHDAREAFRQGTRGVRDELMSLAAPWNFPLAQLRSEVRLWHGEKDLVVPMRIVANLVESIPGAALQRIENAGHLLMLVHWSEMLDWLLN